MLTLVLGIIVIGLIAGALARLIVPGRDGLSAGGTILLGIVGSIVGGALSWLLFARDRSDGVIQFSGLFGSIVGSVLVLLVYRAVGRRRMAH